MRTPLVQSLNFGLLLFVVSCGQEQGEVLSFDKSTKKISQASERQVEVLEDSVSLQKFLISDTISADLNGDGALEDVYFKNGQGCEVQIMVVDGSSGKQARPGVELPVKGLPWSDFSWVEFWGLTADTLTW